MPPTIEGVVSPVLTPIADDGSLALEHVPESVEYAMACGANAIVAAGTGVQETAALTVDEREALMAATIDAVDGEVPVLAGVSHPATAVVEDLVAHAASLGADALLAMPPWGVSPDEAAVLRYFEALAAAADRPVLVYNNPAVSIDMPREIMRDVARIDGIDYVKESSRDWLKIGWLLERVQAEGHADVLTTMDVLLYTLQAGGVGGIIPAPASAPAMRVYEAFHEGDMAAAIAAQRSFGTFPPDSVTQGLTAACKAGAAASGVPVGPPRPPYSPASPAARDDIEAWLRAEDVQRL